MAKKITKLKGFRQIAASAAAIFLKIFYVLKKISEVEIALLTSKVFSTSHFQITMNQSDMIRPL